MPSSPSGAVGTGLAYVLNYRIITDDGPVLASTVTYLLPVVAVLGGFLLLGEPVTSTLVLGVAVVLVGVGLTRRRRDHQPGTSAPRLQDEPRSRRE